MSFSILLYECDTVVSKEKLKLFHEYHDNPNVPTKVSKFKESLRISGKAFHIYRLGKKIPTRKQVYTIENDIVIPSEEVIAEWRTCFAYFDQGSKRVYVKGSDAAWAGEMISQILFKEDEKVHLLRLKPKKIEEDIRKSAKFQSTGTSFIDSDGTKITIRNRSGVDLNENYITKDKLEVDKNHIDFLVEAGGLNFEVFVYEDGKVTIQSSVADPKVALSIFLKIWVEIKDYS